MVRVFLYLVDLPMAVKGVTLPDSSTEDYIVFINENLCEEIRRETIDHELAHIRRDHFRDTIEVFAAEQEAG